MHANYSHGLQSTPFFLAWQQVQHRVPNKAILDLPYLVMTLHVITKRHLYLHSVYHVPGNGGQSPISEAVSHHSFCAISLLALHRISRLSPFYSILVVLRNAVHSVSSFLSPEPIATPFLRLLYTEFLWLSANRKYNMYRTESEMISKGLRHAVLLLFLFPINPGRTNP